MFWGGYTHSLNVCAIWGGRVLRGRGAWVYEGVVADVCVRWMGVGGLLVFRRVRRRVVGVCG